MVEIDPDQLSGESAANVVCAKMGELDEQATRQTLGDRWAVGPGTLNKGLVKADIEEILKMDPPESDEAVEFLEEIAEGIEY